MSLRILILVFCLLKGVSFIKSAEVSEPKVIHAEGSEAVNLYKKVCSELLNFEILLKACLEKKHYKGHIKDLAGTKLREVNPIDIYLISVGPNALDFSFKNIVGTFTILIEKKGDIKIATKIQYDYNLIKKPNGYEII